MQGKIHQATAETPAIKKLVKLLACKKLKISLQLQKNRKQDTQMHVPLLDFF